MKTSTVKGTTKHACPYCHQNDLETMATAPFVRGYIIIFQYGKKSFIGCVPCVRKKVLGEAGLSALVGWFSIKSLIINPFLIVYNLIQGALIKSKPFKVAQMLKEYGIPDNPSLINVTKIGYALAASMIRADGKVEEAEIRMAEEIGERIFDDFDEAAFRLIMKNQTNLPSVKDLTIILKDILNDEGKDTLYKYLVSIAQSDGRVDKSEQTMLDEVARILDVNLNNDEFV